MITPPRALLAILMTLAALVPPAGAQQATVNTDVPAGKWRGVRMRNVPEGALLAVVVKLEGEIGVAVVYGEQGAAGPGATRPLFRGQAVRRLSFSVAAPVTGDYYVILDNRKGARAQSVEVTIAARRGRAPKKPPDPPPTLPRT